MSESEETFEYALKKYNSKRNLAIYSDIKQQKNTPKPQDVISSVSAQLKAIQYADSIRCNKITSKVSNKFKNSTYLSVNKFPVYNEAQKQTTKFDTQCVTDTQLINVIEHAEILDVHRGITQEFETSFDHENTERYTEVCNNNKKTREANVISTEVTKNNSKSDVSRHINSKTVDTGQYICQVETNIDKNEENNHLNNKNNVIDNINDEKGNSNTQKDHLHKKVKKNISETDKDIILVSKNMLEENTQVELLSQILTSKIVIPKPRIKTPEVKELDDILDKSQEEDNAEIFNQCIEITEDNAVIPLSPIFMHKTINTKSKSPSPLVFNLDKFENFESIAVSLLETNDFDTAKHLINSQILNKELCLNTHKVINLNNKDEKTIVRDVMDVDFAPTITDTDVKLMEIDKGTTQEILKQLNDQEKLQTDAFKDEILFSSDEEDYIHKEYQDLPFTCALETSFYDQSDVLDKTMYVGFQTASNRSIQVCTDSFAKAKTMLHDVTTDDVTVTELVENCDKTGKDANDGQGKLDSIVKHVECNEDKDNLGTIDVAKSSVGFMTANNKKISLSEKALARYKKVFHDIDLNENFDTAIESDNFLDTAKNLEQKIEPQNKEKNVKDSMDMVDDALQVIDDDIMQEFVNIEMSLDDKMEKKVVNIKISDNISEIMNDVFKDINFDEDLNENDEKIDVIQSQVISNTKAKSNTGFKTASDKNISVSKEAFVKCKNVFDGIDDIELLNKFPKHIDEGRGSKNIIDEPKTSKAVLAGVGVQNKNMNADNFISEISTNIESVGFKTASSKNIKISEEALHKTKNIFNNIDSIELPKKENKDYPKINSVACSNTVQNVIVGFKTGNNKDIQISNEAEAHIKNILDDIDLTDIEQHINKVNTKVTKDLAMTEAVTRNTGFKSVMNVRQKHPEEKLSHLMTFSENAGQLDKGEPTSETKFTGFKTANNKIIKISNDAIAKSKNIFNDIDTTDFKLPDKIKKDYPDFGENAIEKELTDTSLVQEVPKFVGFKTASNKNVKISHEALIKTKNIFKDVDNNIELGITKDAYPKEFNNSESTKERATSPVLKAVQAVSKKTEEKSPQINKEKIGFIGFQTANKKPVSVSAEALKKSKEVFKGLEIDEGSNVQANTGFSGFQTANKKPVSISAEALDKSKQIFKDLDIIEGSNVQAKTGFSGFQTANNKQVTISKEALAKSKKNSEDFNASNNMNINHKEKKHKSLYPEEIYQGKENDNDLVNNEDKQTNTILKGFHTASRKPVAISKSALEQSKKIFQDISEKSDDFTKISETAVTEMNKLYDKDRRDRVSFKGFQTASNKSVNVTEEALSKSKKLFQDIDTITNIGVKKHDSINFAFKSGNNKVITVSNEALARSKRHLSEVDQVEQSNAKKKGKTDIVAAVNEEIHEIIDTQVINNFDESLHTADFQTTPIVKKSKRSGSPILSCPKAKKRKKFQTPYNNKNNAKTPMIVPNITKIDNQISFTKDYKRNKKYNLKDVAKMTRNLTVSIDPYLEQFHYDTLLQFEFIGKRNDVKSDKEIVTTDFIKDTFLNAVDAKLVPIGWLDNHLKLIMWKLISYEIKFRTIFCTVQNVLDQLKYRYDVELYGARRPAIRKIYEKDDVPSKTLVLCVVGLYIDGVWSSGAPNPGNSIELLLTDGWYCIRSSIDAMLAQLVCKNKIVIGSKLVTCGAELSGSEQAVAPWEDTSSIRLKIFGNSTRRARWDARLGYHGNGAILSQLSSVNVLGGKVSKLRVYVTRVYPALYIEKFEDGSTVTRSERLENIHQMKAEAERQAFMEKLYEEVEKEFADQTSQDSDSLSEGKRLSLDSGSQIAKMMKRSRDPGDFRAQLTTSQVQRLETHTAKKRELLFEDIQKRVRDRIEKAGVCMNRNVVSLLKIRVAGVQEKGDNVDICKGMLSIWKPNDEIRELIKEGFWIEVLNVIPTAIRYSEIQISAGRQSVFSSSKFKPPEKFRPYLNLLQRQCYTVKDLAQNPLMNTDYNEIDTVGLIFLIDPSITEFDSTKQSFQNVYLTDADKNIICVNFWGGLKKFGFQNILDTGQVISCVNLQKRAGNTKKTIPQFRVTEFSYFTQTPKYENSRKLLAELNNKFSSLDRRQFCLDCVAIKNNYSIAKQNNENISPYRYMNNDINNSRNRFFVDSPLVLSKKDDNFNLTGLDFESTFKQDTQLSEEMLKRKKKVNEKIARLKMYGEPPPLSPIHIINRSKHACNSYKSPLLYNNNTSPFYNKTDNSNTNVKNDRCINVASVENTPQKCGENLRSNSPVLLNRTYVKCVNPVKNNFDVKDNNDSIDHFAEEFDGSPPLSLD